MMPPSVDTLNPGAVPPSGGTSSSLLSATALGHREALLEAGRALARGRHRAVPSPSSLGPYRVEGEIGHGGQGRVLRAWDSRLERPVALKTLPVHATRDASRIARLRREAALMARLQDPGICPLYEVRPDHEVPHLVMELVDGPSLADVVASLDGTLAAARPHWRVSVEWVRQVALSMARAHEAGVVHRDLKPSNILLRPDGRPVVVDFGLASVLEGDAISAPTLKAAVGTADYLAPEQLDPAGRSIDGRADVWALGVTLFETLTGAPPFRREGREATYQAILREPMPAPRGLPSDLRSVLGTALRKQPAERYESMADLAADLGALLEDRPVRVRPESSWSRGVRWARRNPLVAISSGLVVLGLLIALWVLGISRQEARRERREADALTERLRATLAHEAEARARTLSLTDAALLRDLIRQADEELWPRRPERLAAMEEWLRRSSELLSRVEDAGEELEGLRREAAPLSAADRGRQEELRRRLHRDLVRRREDLRARKRELEAAGPKEAARLQEVSARLSALEKDPRVTGRLLYRFGDAAVDARHEAMTAIVAGVPVLRALMEDVQARREHARSIEKRTLLEAAPAWRAVMAALAADERYEGMPRKPLVGLIPLGRDRHSGLWEFWHVGSGRRPRWSGSFESGRAGRPQADTGLVFVLVPGGSFLMGAQAEDEKSPRYDRWAEPVEGPVHEVRLAPYLLSKFEMTRAQWRRLAGGDAVDAKNGTLLGNQRVGPVDPITNVSGEEAPAKLARWSLALPTEAQWEHAARAGTPWPWWTGPDPKRLSGVVNLADETHRRHGGRFFSPELEDGHSGFAPVGSFPPNPFGMQEILGNVWEMCRDPYARYSNPVRPGSGLRLADPTRRAVRRGGGFASLPRRARVTQRVGAPDTDRAIHTGLRPIFLP